MILCLTDPCNTPAGNKRHRVTLMKVLDRDKYETSTLQNKWLMRKFRSVIVNLLICQKPENNYEIMIVNNSVIVNLFARNQKTIMR